MQWAREFVSSDSKSAEFSRRNRVFRQLWIPFHLLNCRMLSLTCMHLRHWAQQYEFRLATSELRPAKFRVDAFVSGQQKFHLAGISLGEIHRF